MEPKFPSLILRTGKRLAIEESQLADCFRGIQQGLFLNWGLLTPLARLVIDDKLPEYGYQLQLDDHEFPLLTKLRPGEFAVLMKASEFNEKSWEGKKWQAREPDDPQFRENVAIIEAESTGQPLWKESGPQVLDPSNYIFFTLGFLTGRQMADFVTTGLTEYYLGKLGAAFPVLVGALRERFDLTAVTETLRSRLKNGGHIKNLVGILEEMLARPVAS